MLPQDAVAAVRGYIFCSQHRVLPPNCVQWWPLSVHPRICAGGGFGIECRRVPGVEKTQVGAALLWLIPQKFGPGKEEMLGKKEHPDSGTMCPPPRPRMVLTAASTKITQDAIPATTILKKMQWQRGYSGEAGGYRAGNEIPTGVRRPSWSSAQRPGRKIHTCRRFIVSRVKCSTDIFKTWGH